MENFNDLICTNNNNLFYVIEKGKNGYYAESLENDNVKFISYLTNDVKYLNEETIHTYSNHLELKNVLLKMKKHKNLMPSENANKEVIKSYFRTIVPEYNEKRTLIKNLKKFIHFYNLIEMHKKRTHDSIPLYGNWKMEYKAGVLTNNKVQYV